MANRSHENSLDALGPFFLGTKKLKSQAKYTVDFYLEII